MALQLTSTTLGRFCRELAGGLDHTHVLIEEWGITPAQFDALKLSAAFKAEMAVVQREMQELGADAGFIYRMKSLCEDMLPDFVKLAKDPATPTGTKFEMIKWTAEMARLKEKASPASQQVQNRGPSVVFHFGPGLPITSMTVVPEAPEAIDVTPAVPAIQILEGFDLG